MDLERKTQSYIPSPSSFSYPLQVIPGRFFAMRGPKQLPGGRLYMDRASGSRDFSPEHYTDILVQLGVRVVLRLTDSEYDEQVCLVRVCHRSGVQKLP